MVEKYIEQFLLYYYYCPLPGVGVLRIVYESAVIDMAEKKISSPVQKITFSTEEFPANDLVSYISIQSKQTLEESGYLLQEVCQQISEITSSQTFQIGSIGSFIKNDAQGLLFQQEENFLFQSPTLTIQRVIHPDSTHKVLVGDVELTNVIIHNRSDRPSKAVKLSWGVWAACLFMIASALIVIYLIDEKSSTTFGNAMSVNPTDAIATYQDYTP